MDDPVSSSSTAATQDEPTDAELSCLQACSPHSLGPFPQFFLLLTAFASGQMGPAGLYVIVDTALILLGLAGVMITSVVHSAPDLHCCGRRRGTQVWLINSLDATPS